jgi:hypothetical protein
LVDDKTAEALEEFARQQGFRRIEDVDGYRRFAGGSGDSAEVTGTSALSSPMCPRQGWHTGPLAFRGRAFRLTALIAE